MNFEWSSAKARSNLSKHGIAFEDAARVFFDAQGVEAYDGREVYGEDRWTMIGRVGAAILYVVYTVRDEDTVRLISARKANRDEERRYDQTNA